MILRRALLAALGLLLVTGAAVDGGAVDGRAALAVAPPSDGPLAGPATATSTLAAAHRSSSGTVVQVDLTSLEPRSLTASDTLRIGGTLRSTGDAPLQRVQLRLGVGSRLDSRNTLTAADAGIDDDPVRRVALDDPGRNRALAVGQQVSFSVSVPVSDLGLGRLGVYPVRLEVSAVDDGSRRTVGQLRTYLPWFPDGVAAPVSLAWLVPLGETPSRSADGTLLNDRLVQDVADGGRLDRLLTALLPTTGTPTPGGSVLPGTASPAGQTTSSAPSANGAPPSGSVAATPVPGSPVAPEVTLAVDPSVLDTLDALRTGTARLPDTPATASPAPGLEEVDPPRAAGRFLDRLAVAARGRATIVLPYADADVDALADTGHDRDLADVLAAGPSTVARLLPEALARTDVAWPYSGVVSPAGLAALTVAGTRTVVLNDTTVDRSDITTYTPGTRVTLSSIAGTPVTALLSDHGLDTLVARVDRAAGVLPSGTDADMGALVLAERRSPRLAEQRFLAETALIAAERQLPRTRTMLVTPPRAWDPDPAYLTAVLADTAGAVPWLTPATLHDAVTSDVTATIDSGPAITRAQREEQLSEGYLNRIDDARLALHQLQSVLSDPTVLAQADLTLLRATSAWFRHRSGGAALEAGARDQVNALTGHIRITTIGRVTLTGQTGQIPVTVNNDLPQSVTVRLVGTSGAPERLRLESPQQVTIAPGTRLQLRLDATVRVRGVVPVTLQLQTPDGAALGPTTDLTVSATAFGRFALGLTLAAAALLMVLVGLRLVRKAVRLARGGPSDTPSLEVPNRQEPR